MRTVTLLLILALTVAIFSPCLDNSFTTWDDDVYVTDNPLVASGFPRGSGAIFTTFVSGNYHPLVLLSHAVEYRLFGLNPRPYHAVNLALHLLVTALVFHLLLAVLGGNLAAAAAGALFFAVHPLRVETVAWVADRKDLLGAAFFLGGVAAHLRDLRQPGRLPRALVFLLFLLALLSKATTVVFPLALLLCDWLRERLDARAAVRKVPLFALSVLFGAIAVTARESYQGVLQEGGLGAGETVFLGAYRLLCHYLVRFALPGTLAFPLYPSLEPGIVPLIPWLLGLAAALLALGLLVALSLRRTRGVAFGALFFLVTLLPSLTVEVLGFSADRFTYLPAFGISCVAGEVIRLLLAGRAGAMAAGRGALLAVTVVAATALGIASRERCAIWRDSVSLWTAAVDVGPGQVVCRGRALAAAGDRKGARRDFEAVLALDPRQVDALVGRGILAAEAGDDAEARKDFGRALAADSRSAAANLNLGVLHLNRGEYVAALPLFTQAAEIDPRGGAAFYGRARARLALGNLRGAREDFERALALGYRDDFSLRETLRAGDGR